LLEVEGGEADFSAALFAKARTASVEMTVFGLGDEAGKGRRATATVDSLRE